VIILDTNVISELMKSEPAAAVFGWVGRWRGEALFTTAVNQAEVLFGLEVMHPGRKRESLRHTAVRMFEQYFRDRILPFDLNAAQPYADIVARRQKAGRPIDELDAQIASIAAYRTMAVATRDTTGFDNCGIQIINPWTA
jgi:predicted nucleic acid-binding protein